MITGEFTVVPGTTINIVVGGTGANGALSMGGGGAGEEWTTNGCNARSDNYSSSVPFGCTALLNDGNGATGGNNYGGGGGAGWFSDGLDYGNWPNSGGDRWTGGDGEQSVG